MELVGAPKLISRVDPEYPTTADSARTRAAVTLRIIINEEGQVWSAQVIDGPPHFCQAALNTVMRWVFAPTLIQGKVVPVITSVRVHFGQPKEAQGSDEKDGWGAAAPGREPGRASGSYLQSRILRMVEPEYPPAARANRVSGVVIVSVVVNEDGEVFEAEVLRGHPLLDQAALDAVRRWLFKPTVIHDDPVPVLGTISVIFNLR
jgi:TonB family protein